MKQAQIRTWTLDGRERRRGLVREFSCISSVDTPADSLRAVVMGGQPADWEEEITELDLQYDGRRLFGGMCDRQTVSMGTQGCQLTLWGRSEGAVLLDNEAIPQEYSRVSLEEMFQRHIQPYGFTADLERSAVLEHYQVGKGVSEWEAFSRFCLRAVKLRPYLDGKTVRFLLPGRGRRVISSRMPVLRMSKTVRRSEVISQVLVRDEQGWYQSGIENSEAQRLQIRRRRCLIPSAQWAQTGVDAGLRLEESMRGRVRWEVELAGIADWELGCEVLLAVPGSSQHFQGNLVERELKYRESGAVSRLVLE